MTAKFYYSTQTLLVGIEILRLLWKMGFLLASQVEDKKFHDWLILFWGAQFWEICAYCVLGDMNETVHSNIIHKR
jgi:hypothetical protein